MNTSNDKNSAEQENKKVQTDKQFEDNEIKEGKADSSIFQEDNDKSAYPYKHDADKQYKTQPEYIDRDGEDKDKS